MEKRNRDNAEMKLEVNGNCLLMRVFSVYSLSCLWLHFGLVNFISSSRMITVETKSQMCCGIVLDGIVGFGKKLSILTDFVCQNGALKLRLLIYWCCPHAHVHFSSCTFTCIIGVPSGILIYEKHVTFAWNNWIIIKTGFPHIECRKSDIIALWVHCWAVMRNIRTLSRMRCREKVWPVIGCGVVSRMMTEWMLWNTGTSVLISFQQRWTAMLVTK